MKRSFGITFCALFISATAILEMKTLINATWYWHVFEYLPQDQIMMRYITSLTGRILLMVAAIGIWRLQNRGRLLAIILFVVALISLPWKHPVAAIANSLTYNPLPIINELLGESKMSRADLISWAAITIHVRDLLLNSALIFFLTRPAIKKQFN